jgi:hypothetical protein
VSPRSNVAETHYRAAVETLTKAAEALRDLSPFSSTVTASPHVLVAVAQTHALLALVAVHDPWLEAQATQEVERDACA